MFNLPETNVSQTNHSIQDVLNLLYRQLRGQDANVSGLAIDLPIQPLSSHNSGLDISTAKTLTPPAGAGKILIQVLTQNARFTLDGSTPTASTGFQIQAGDPPFIISVVPGLVIKIIQESPSASLQYQWST